MATVLVSFIGNGNLTGNEYYSTNYKFEGETDYRKTKIFGSVLLQHLIDNERSVDSWLIMGTKESIWFDLIEILENPSLSVEEKQLQEFLFNNALNSSTNTSEIKPNDLIGWQSILNQRLDNTEIICRLVGDATTEDSQESIFKSLDEVIGIGDEIVFDVTHGLRNQPIITIFILMYLRYSKEINIENIRFYYASLDSTKTIGTVHRINYCNKLLKATEAVAIFRQTGHYEQIGKNLNLSKDFNNKLEMLAFSDEVNRTDSTIPTELNQELSQANFSPLEESLYEEFKTPLYWAEKEKLSNQLKEKALFAYNRKQYFKAILILTEAIIVAYGENCGDNTISSNLELYSNRQKAKKQMLGDDLGIPTGLNSNELQAFKNLNKLRNSIAHGTDTNGTEIEAIKAQESIEDEGKLKEIFTKSNTLFEKITKGEIGQ